MSTFELIVLHPEPAARDRLRRRLEGDNRRVRTAGNLASAVQPPRPANPRLLVSARDLPDEDALGAWECLRTESVPLDMILLAPVPERAVDFEAWERGVLDILRDPIDMERLVEVVDAVEERSRRGEPDWREGATPDPVDQLVGASRVMQELRHEVALLSRGGGGVVVEGETGVGKGLVARVMHLASVGADRPFVTVDCGAVPDTLIESELFGHRRGAFTGAVANRAGAFARASGGTLFLDEIANASPRLQQSLLRVLEDREFTPVGGKESIVTDVRVIVASNEPLVRMVEEERFRADLYYRLGDSVVRVPPLRERLDDIPDLVPVLLRQIWARMADGPALPHEAFATGPALETLGARDWLGNVRELRMVLSGSLARAPGRVISSKILFFPATPRSVRGGGTKPPVEDLDLARKPFGRTSAGPSHGPGDLIHLNGSMPSYAETERRYIQALLNQTAGNVSEAARIAEVPRTTFLGRMSRLGLRSVSTSAHPTTLSRAPPDPSGGIADTPCTIPERSFEEST